MPYKYQVIEFSQTYEGREGDYTPHFTDDKSEARGLSEGSKTSQRPPGFEGSSIFAPYAPSLLLSLPSLYQVAPPLVPGSSV